METNGSVLSAAVALPSENFVRRLVLHDELFRGSLRAFENNPAVLRGSGAFLIRGGHLDFVRNPARWRQRAATNAARCPVAADELAHDLPVVLLRREPLVAREHVGFARVPILDLHVIEMPGVLRRRVVVPDAQLGQLAETENVVEREHVLLATFELLLRFQGML